MTANMAVDENTAKIKRLKTIFKGSVLLDVNGCYGKDFEKQYIF